MTGASVARAAWAANPEASGANAGAAGWANATPPNRNPANTLAQAVVKACTACENTEGSPNLSETRRKPASFLALRASGRNARSVSRSPSYFAPAAG